MIEKMKLKDNIEAIPTPVDIEDIKEDSLYCVRGDVYTLNLIPEYERIKEHQGEEFLHHSWKIEPFEAKGLLISVKSISPPSNFSPNLTIYATCIESNENTELVDSEGATFMRTIIIDTDSKAELFCVDQDLEQTA